MNEIISDRLWSLVKPLFDEKRTASAGRPRANDREVLSGIVYVLRADIPWNRLPRRLGLGSGMTCLRRLRQWQDQGRWLKIERLLKRHLPISAEIDWLRTSQRRRSKRLRGPSDQSPGPLRNKFAQIGTALALGFAESLARFQ
ncbi:MAG TPA: transposase [Pirellulales bacterium]